MKKITVLLILLFGFYLTGFTADVQQEYSKDSKEIYKTEGKKLIAEKNHFKKCKVFKIKKTGKKFRSLKKLLSIKNIKEEGKDIILAYVLGCVLGLFGVLITFLIYIKHKDRRSIVKWAWYGFFTLLLLIVFAVIVAL